MMRVFTVVTRFESATTPFVRDFAARRHSCSARPAFLSSDHPERFDLSSECGDVYGDISRAAKAFTLLDEINDGNRRFR